MALLPSAANLATLAVVVAATWWSGAQRPLAQPALAAAEATASSTAALPLQQGSALPAAGAAKAGAPWPTDATTLARNGLQAVGFQTRTQR